MKRNEELESNLLELFSQSSGKRKEDYLIEKIEDNNLTIREREAMGEGEVSFRNGYFFRFSEKLLSTNKFISFFNKQKGDVIRRTCDGIFLTSIAGRTILCLVELKKIINNDFRKAIRQIEGSYLKTAMILSLRYNIKNLELVVFIAGKIEPDPDLSKLGKIEAFGEIEYKIATKLKEFSRNKQVNMNFPFFLEQNIHENYRKKNIKVYHLRFDSIFDLQTLI